MKKTILLAAFLATAFAAFSQGTYMGLGVNYGLPCGGNTLGMKTTEDLSANTGSYENIRGSFGSGVTLGYYVGYMFNANIGFDVNADYLWGKKYNFSSNTNYGGGNYSTSTDEVTATTFRVSPEIRIGFQVNKIYPYARAGATFGLFNKLIDNYTGTDQNSIALGPDISERKYELTRGLSIGCIWGMGARYQLNDVLSVFGEATGYLSSWAPEKGELVKATLNGEDVLASMNVADKEFEFSDKVDRSGTYDPNKPTQSLKTYFPMSSFGFTVGIHVSF